MFKAAVALALGAGVYAQEPDFDPNAVTMYEWDANPVFDSDWNSTSGCMSGATAVSRAQTYSKGAYCQCVCGSQGVLSYK